MLCEYFSVEYFRNCTLGLLVISAAVTLDSRSVRSVVSTSATHYHTGPFLSALNFYRRVWQLNCEVSAFHPSGVGNWVPVIAGKAKAGMAHSNCGWACGCAGKKLKPFENTFHAWALLLWRFTTHRHYIKCMHLHLLPLPLPFNRWIRTRYAFWRENKTAYPMRTVKLPHVKIRDRIIPHEVYDEKFRCRFLPVSPSGVSHCPCRWSSPSSPRSPL